ncbi:hypothetical protein SAMN05216480_101299 [Pustulibacterium marinum]|uniref:Oxygen sensor histidine kinase NreB n=1 Tax=Pustulibacterium marinum TaxID=1224947 RepID=A0A1I7EVI1_9FLAO|nr:ATP-binding protein [Pustulibacterium marinum]SFU27938.1 hypothetical protein SAMN05216480_101299 [Pustulibacterium marinum]
MSILKNRSTTRLYLATICWIVAFSCFAQSNSITAVDSLLTTGNYDEAIQLYEQTDLDDYTVSQKARLQFLISKAYRYQNKMDLELQYLIQARENYSQLDSLEKLDEINLQIIQIQADVTNDFEQSRAYVEDYIIDVKKRNDPKMLSKAYRELGIIFYQTGKYPKEAVSFLRKATEQSKIVGDEYWVARNYQTLGATLSDYDTTKIDSAIYYFDQALKVYKKLNQKSRLALLYLNYGVAYHKIGEYQKALEEFYKADTASLDEFKLAVKSYVPFYRKDTYLALGDYKAAYKDTELYHAIYDSIKEQDQKEKIKEFEVRYKTAEKELENQKLTSRIKVNNVLLWALSGAIILLLIISFLIYKFISKKRKIAEQEKALETQKMQTVLKEQELHEIDVMLESQEKERQRIANDLHDSLGSLLSALKLNFNTLGRRESKDEVTKKLYKKTEELINETYVQVRNISHLKNLGVMGKEGLLSAVKKMAEKMTVINRLEFKVIPFGLDERIESNLEITLFRIIQELCGNIIKHSEATEVNIYLTQHKNDHLNIMIEDNGKGFDIAILKEERSGIGLKNIERKVEQMGGTLTIDSAKNTGTTIIIDIPL